MPKDSVVVDVGGGVGSQSLTVARANPHLKLIVQDRDPVIADAQKVKFSVVLVAKLTHHLLVLAAAIPSGTRVQTSNSSRYGI